MAVVAEFAELVTQGTSKEQAIKECSLETGNDLAAKVLVEKYFLVDDNGLYLESKPQHMWNRLATAIALAEPKEIRENVREDMLGLLDDWKFVPAGRVLYGLGNPYVSTTLKNCYVIAIEEDSIEGIFNCISHMAKTYRAGGGCGIDISVLRPKGTRVNNAAREATGPVSFMELFSRVTGTIGQKGRIGALLISIDVTHPDVLEFIKIKGGNDLNAVRNANVSVKITDEFMEAVINNKKFDLQWGGTVYKTINARELWNELIHFAWKRAEPGLLFWDKTRNECPAHNYKGFECLTTNPCLSGDTRIFTAHGYQTARELWARGDFNEWNEVKKNPEYQLQVVNNHGIVQTTHVYRTSESAPLYRVTFNNGSYVNATSNHKFIIGDGHERRALEELQTGDMIPLCRQTAFGDVNYIDYAMLAGWVIGDGSISWAPTGMRAHVRCWNDDIENVMPALRDSLLAVYARSNRSTDQNPSYDADEGKDAGFDYRKKTMQSFVLGRLLAEDGLTPGDKHRVPNSVWMGTSSTISAFLRGLFSADGGVQINERKKSVSVRLSQSNERILLECQLLLSQLGIDSDFVHRRKKSKQFMNDGKGGKKSYNRKAQYELIISRRDNLVNFATEVGFIQQWKNDILRTWLDSHKGSRNSAQRTHLTVRSIEYVGEEETFCLTEPKDHEITVAGIRIGQCGEVALSHGDSCNLGSMNLSKYVLNPFSSKAAFNYNSFGNDVAKAVRFLDNIITLEKAPEQFQQWANDHGRRLGLGIMGLADMFIKLGIKYDTEEAVEIADSVMEKFMVSSYSASIDLAKEKGAFSEFDEDIHNRSDFIKRLPDNIKLQIENYGLRNIAIHAIAPTGSIGLIAQCSSATEPIFQVEHVRKTNMGTAKEVGHHKVFHPLAKEWMDNNSGAKLPDYFVSSYEISPDMRIKMQGRIQKYIDQSISNTVNLPSTATEDEISTYYMAAWRAGCKGITVYRDGSREGILVSSNEKKEEGIKVQRAPERPEALDATVHVIKPNGSVYTVFIGLLNGRVYEVFALPHEQARIADGLKGKLVREKIGHNNVYNFECGPMIIRQLNRYEETEASLITRLLSTALRHGTPLEFAIDQIAKSQVSMTSFAKAIARALSLYVKKEELVGKFKCYVCNSRNIKFEGLCRTCLDCGDSKCQ